MAAQHPGLVASIMLAAVGLAAMRHPPRLMIALGVSLAAYIFTDLYLNVLHMFLDHEQSMSHSFGFICSLAAGFQEHHGDTTYVFVENHSRDIDHLISTVSLVLLGWHGILALVGRGPFPRPVYLWTFLVLVFGEVAIINHSYMHARTHGIAIPTWIAVLQDVGVLPSNSFHRVHHTVFDRHFAFLVGGSRIYDALYLRCPGYQTLSAVFWAAQPHTAISAFSVGWLLSGAARLALRSTDQTYQCTKFAHPIDTK